MVIHCSNCNKKLIEVKDAESNQSIDYKVQCCFCNDFSFAFKAAHGAKMSGVGQEVEHEYVCYQDDEESITDKFSSFEPKVKIVGMTRTGGNSWLIKTVKG